MREGVQLKINKEIAGANESLLINCKAFLSRSLVPLFALCELWYHAETDTHKLNLAMKSD